MNIVENAKMAFRCVCDPLSDLVHIMFFCCGKKHRCQICGIRFKNISRLSKHIRDDHKEIFSFGTSIELTKNRQRLYSKISD